ncbi:50S ribosomal protein L11 methyltransferase [Bdellovibrio sp. HCB185ZH]|uniref:50S ribosomal protein L11 methyltransferase n=1 Tax=Bdellovibrio sp. HCB185ZH TaxID=3394235 RepID=UPI0039A6262C
MSEKETSPKAQPPLSPVHAWHYDMLIDHERNHFYETIIKNNCKDKVVLEIGAGSGLMSVLAIRHGAKKVYCCEANPLLAKAAELLINRMGMQDRITLIQGFSTDIPTDAIPKVDMVLHELFASDPFAEDVIHSLRDAKRFMKPDAIYVPEGIQLTYQAVHGHALRQELKFAGIELIEMTQLLGQVHPALRNNNNPGFPNKTYFLPKTSMESLVKNSFDHQETNPDLVGIDAVEVTYKIYDHETEMQAAPFGLLAENRHWSTQFFYKTNLQTDHLHFCLNEQEMKLLVI